MLVAVSLFVVIGIAVDDVFVWVDLWRQQDRSVSLEDRMIQTLGESDERAVAVTTHGICPHRSYQSPYPLMYATHALFTTLLECHSEHLLLGETREQHQVVDGCCCPQRHCPH